MVNQSKHDEGDFAIVALLSRLYKLYISGESTGRLVSDFGYYQDGLRKARAKVTPGQWVDTLPDLSAHLETYKNTVLRLKAFADAQGAKIVFLTQPFVWSDNMSRQAQDQLMAGFIGGDNLSPETRWYTPNALEEGVTAYNNTLLETCKNSDLYCIDVAKQIPHEAEYFYDDFHFSAEGAALVAKTVAESFSKNMEFCKKQ